MSAKNLPDLAALGHTVRERRRELNLTQDQLAQRLGWGQERVSILERGKYGMPSLPLLAHLAEALDLPLGDLTRALGFQLSESGEVGDTHKFDDGDRRPVQAALSYTLQRLLAIPALTLKDAMNEASNLMAETMGADKVDVFMYEAETESLVALGTSNTEMGRLEARAGLDRVPLANGGPQVEAFLSGVEYYTGHADQNPEIERGLVHALGVRTLCAVPLRVDGSIGGLLVAESAQPDRFSAEERDFFEAASRWVAMVAHRAELHEALTRNTAEQARRAVADEMLTLVAHDLGNQITPIKGRIDLLLRRIQRRGGDDNRDTEDLRNAADSLDRLGRMVTDLLDASRLEGGVFSLSRQPTDLVDLVHQVVDEARNGRPNIEARTPDELEVEADPARVRQLLHNLIGNALRHTPAGARVLVSVGSVTRGDGEWASVQVHDEGPGIAAELLPNLFARHATGGESAGHGLGLYLARGIATAHGGELSVESEVGKGTTFTLLLPLPE